MEWQDDHYRTWAENYDPLIARWLPTQKQLQIADLGCGVGNLLWLLKARQFTEICGVESDPKQALMAGKIAPVDCEDAITWLDKRKNTFDFLFVLDLLEHFPLMDAYQFLDNCFSALRPNGKILIQTPNALAFRPVYSFGDPTHVLHLSARSLESILRKAGFQKIECFECRPRHPHRMKEKIRTFVWESLRKTIRFFDQVEAFDPSTSNILTRNFFAFAQK